MTGRYVTCPNCKGRNSRHWPLGPCTLCKGTGQIPESTPSDAEMEDPEAYRLYRLCPCAECNGTGKATVPPHNTASEKFVEYAQKGRCKTCRGEGRNLELLATCGTKEAVGVALVTLAGEDEWDECPFGLMYRPEGKTGKWLIKPWGPSPRNVSDAGKLLRAQR